MKNKIIPDRQINDISPIKRGKITIIHTQCMPIFTGILAKLGYANSIGNKKAIREARITIIKKFIKEHICILSIDEIEAIIKANSFSSIHRNFQIYIIKEIQSNIQ